MKYRIHITQKAERDMIDAADHIEFVLMNPQAADALLDEAEEKINSLSSFPKKFALANDPVLSSWGIRYLAVKNYLAFYVIDESSSTVHIIRFLYKRRNWMVLLREGFSTD